jgi:hypothetical protein
MREERQNILKILAPLPLRETYRLVPLSAEPISLDSTLKVYLRVHSWKKIILLYYISCMYCKYIYVSH